MPRPRKSNRADGRFEIKRTIGHTVDGKLVRKSFFGKNHAEALQAYHNYLSDQEKRKEERKNMLFSSWVERWLETYKENDVKPTTYASSYLRPCKNYILPFFKDRFIQDITQMHIKQLLNENAHLSQSTLDKIVICLRGIFEAAIDNDIISKNPCRNIKVKSTAKKNIKRTYDRESAEALCRVDHPYSLYVHILLVMGLRCSELCGLRWQDIDFEKRTLTVNQALTCEGGRIFIEEPKTTTSRRKLPIPPDLLARLRAKQAENKETDIEREYVATFNGKHLRPDHFSDMRFEAFYNAAGVPKDKRLSPHELRHTCGTLLYKATKDIYHVSKFLGHSDIGITTKTYVHSEMQSEEIHLDI